MLSNLDGDIGKLDRLRGDIKGWHLSFHYHYHHLNKIMLINDHQLQEVIRWEMYGPQSFNLAERLKGKL